MVSVWCFCDNFEYWRRILNQYAKSFESFEKAQKVMPGGVSSPVRAFSAVGGNPFFVKKAQGARLWDVDGNCYVDYVGSWGPAILGHAHKQVLEAVVEACGNGLSFGAPSLGETKLAQALCDVFPSVDKVRFVSSGTEACMSAIRLARGFTKRAKVIKFDGNYHGHADSMLVKAGSGVATLGIPGSPGVAASVAADTLIADYNSLESVAALFDKYPQDIAAVIVEPIVGNSGFIRGEKAFLEGVQSLCKRNGAVFIVDEVMTGFRTAFGGVQTLLGLEPDLTTFGKVIGGGMPLAAYAGRDDLMSLVAPSGPVYQAGTLSGNPVAVAAGLKTLELLREEGVYRKLSDLSEYLTSGITKLAKIHKIPFVSDFEAGMFGWFFTDEKVTNFSEALASQSKLFPIFFREMLNRGINLAPSPFEAGFVSLAHTFEDLDQTLEAADQAFAIVSRSC